jgi:hypothetical protein
LNSNELHGVISQKIELSITTAVRTSNPAYSVFESHREQSFMSLCSVLSCVSCDGRAFQWVCPLLKKFCQRLHRSKYFLRSW